MLFKLKTIHSTVDKWKDDGDDREAAYGWIFLHTNFWSLVIYKFLLQVKRVFFFPPKINQVTHDQAVVLQNALQSIPNPSSECILRHVSIRLAQQISDEVSIKCRKFWDLGWLTFFYCSWHSFYHNLRLITLRVFTLDSLPLAKIE